jgi:hypothetical protein
LGGGSKAKEEKAEMKKKDRQPGRFRILWTPVLMFVIIFAFIAIALPFAASVSGIVAMTGSPEEPDLFAILFPIANWPSLLTRTYPMFVDENGVAGYDILKGLYHPLTLIANGLGWGLIGFVIGIGISALMSIKKKRK